MKIPGFINKNFFIITIIILLGLLLRLIGIHKLHGLWVDEMVLYTQASQSFPWGIINYTLSKDAHLPLFQLLLHLWMNLFGNNDTVLRLFSVLIGIANIFVIYLAGKELDSRKTGFIAALAVSINSLLIYYSQEVKFYSFLPLFATISALFLVRIIKNPSKFNYWGFILSNLVISYTFTIGISYVAVEIAVLAVYLFIKKKNFKEFLKIHSYFLILLIPLIIMFFRIIAFDKQDFTGGFTAFYQDIQCIVVILQNWFSPVLIGLINNPPDYIATLFNSYNAFVIVLFILFPFLFYLLGIINAIRQKNYTLILFIISASFLLLEALAAVFTRFACITRYTIIGLPLIILFASYGLSKISNKKFLYSLLGIFTILNICFILAYPVSAPKLSRPGGLKIPSIALKNIHNFKKSDVLIFPLYETLFDKYANINATKLSVFNDFIVNRKFLNIILSHADVERLNADNCQNIFKNYIYQTGISKPFDNYVRQELFSKIPSNGYFVVILDKSMIFPASRFKEILAQNSYYDAPFVFMLLTKVTDDISRLSDKYLHLVSVYKVDSWEICVYKKQ